MAVRRSIYGASELISALAPPPNPRGNWVTATGYVLGDAVISSGTNYECRIAHTSGTFATDLAAGKWAELGSTHAAAVALPADAAGWLHDDGAGALAWSTPSAATVVGQFTGTPNGSKFLRDDGTLATPAGGGGTGLLAKVAYAPGTEAVYNSAVTTLAALDATNLTVSFVAPASGAVIVRLSALVLPVSSSIGQYFGLLDHTTTTTVYGNTVLVGQVANAVYVSVPITITGLTPGTTYQMDWANCNGGAGTSHVYAQGVNSKAVTGGTVGPAVIEVWSA